MSVPDMRGAQALRRTFRRYRRSKRTWGVLAAAAALVVGVAIPAMAVTGSPSSFESGDGNMTLQTPGNTDWNCFVNSDNFAKNGTTPSGCAVTTGATQITADQPNEVTWVNGQKFDTQCPALQTGSVPNKDDFTNVASFNETASNLDTFFYGATIRATANGNSSGDVEFNQGSGNGTTSAGCRTAGDRLMAYDFLNGGTSLNFHVLTWIDSAHPNLGGNAGTCFVKTDPLPCWGANVITVAPSLFDGQANQAAITAGNNGISGTALVINQFAEFGVNLTQALGLGGKCFSFPQQVWESRSSGSSFTSNPEDIELEQHTISNCGEVRVIKQTDPRGKDKVFSFTSNLPAHPSAGGVTCAGNTGAGIQSDGSFCLNDAGNSGKTQGSTDPAQNSTGNTVDTGSDVLQGSYTVSEGTVPGGFTFESLTCTADPASGSSVNTSGQTASITLKPQGVVTCLYTNKLNTATLATQVSATDPVFPGVAVHDTATVTGNQAADTPSGNVEFFLCGPIATGSCSSGGTDIGAGTLSGSGATASADSPDVNTSANPLGAGRYCFRAEWPGDANYPTALAEFGGADGTNECFTVQTIKTTTTTTPSVGSGGTTTFGSSVTDHAVVQAQQSGDGTPTGTVSFFICDPSQTVAGACPDGSGSPVGGPVTTTAVANSDPPASSADSTAVTANKTGTWCWRAVYTPGGINGSNYTGSEDASPGECFTVTDTTTSVSAQNWLPNDTATVTSDNGAPLNGTLSAQLFTGADCGATSGGPVSGQVYSVPVSGGTSATLTTNNNSYFVSDSMTVSWLITFTSSDPNVSNSSHCESTSLTINN